MGDVDQAIAPQLSLEDWEELKPIFGQRFRYEKLTKSYRSSKEITSLASVIPSVTKEIVNFFEEGRKPRLLELPSEADPGDVAELIVTEIGQLREKGNQSIGIICRTREEVRRIMRRLPSRLPEGMKAKTIRDEDDVLEDADIAVLPIYLAKGLEFDAVILPDVSSENYGAEADRRILYTAITRPLHDLTMIVCNDRSPFLPIPEAQLYDLISLELPKRERKRPQTGESTPQTTEKESPFAAMSEAELLEALRDAYAARTKAPTKVRSQVTTLIKPIKGFPNDPLKAPFDHVVKKLTRRAQSTLPEDFGPIAALWQLAHKATLLTEIPAPKETAETAPPAPEKEVHPMPENPPLADDNEIATQLTFWRDLDSESSLWQSLDDYINELMQISAAKQEERKATITLRRANQLIEQLVSSLDTLNEDIGCSPQTWNITDMAATEIQTFLPQLEELNQKINEYSENNAKAGSLSVQERIVNYQRQATLLGEIPKLSSSIQASLKPTELS